MESKILKRYLYMHICSSIVHNSQKMEVSFNELMDRHKLVYTYNGISFSLTKKANSDTCYTMEKP